MSAPSTPQGKGRQPQVEDGSPASTPKVKFYGPTHERKRSRQDDPDHEDDDMKPNRPTPMNELPYRRTGNGPAFGAEIVQGTDQPDRFEQFLLAPGEPKLEMEIDTREFPPSSIFPASDQRQAPPTPSCSP